MNRRARTIRNAASRRALRRGFTLIELLLVLVILAVLAGIVVPKFTGRSEDARKAAATQSIAGLTTALEAFEIDNGRYPTTDEGLLALIEQPASLETWKRPYIPKVPRDPWGNEFIYESPGRYNEYDFDLYSMGPDLQEGTEDDIVNWDTERAGGAGF